MFELFLETGVGLDAFATLCETPIGELLLMMAGYDDRKGCVPNGLVTVVNSARNHAPNGARETLCVATHGPQGSIRWHQWRVHEMVVDSFLAGRIARRKDIETFQTWDNTTVYVNAKNVITVLYGDEIPPHIVAPDDIIRPQILTGDPLLWDGEAGARSAMFATLRNAMVAWYQTATGEMDPDSIPFRRDQRRVRAFLRDLKQPLIDHCVDVPNADQEGISGLHMWQTLYESDVFSNRVTAFADDGGTLINVFLSDEQVTVAECPTHLIERHRHVTKTAAIRHGQTLGPVDHVDYRKKLNGLGLFSAQEVDRMVAEYSMALASQMPKPSP